MYDLLGMAKRKTAEERKAEATVQTTAFLARFAELVGPDEIIEAGMRLGALERQRKVDLPKLVQATILALSPVPGTQMTGFQNYIGLTGVEIAPSTFYDRFNLGWVRIFSGGQDCRECKQLDTEGALPGTVEVRAKTKQRESPFDERSLCETDSGCTRSSHIRARPRAWPKGGESASRQRDAASGTRGCGVVRREAGA
jgi:hypothetical protein